MHAAADGCHENRRLPLAAFSTSAWPPEITRPSHLRKVGCWSYGQSPWAFPWIPPTSISLMTTDCNKMFVFSGRHHGHSVGFFAASNLPIVAFSCLFSPCSMSDCLLSVSADNALVGRVLAADWQPQSDHRRRPQRCAASPAPRSNLHAVPLTFLAERAQIHLLAAS